MSRTIGSENFLQEAAHKVQLIQAVRELRSAMGLTQQQFADEVNTALTTVARWETIRSPRGRTLLDLARLAETVKRPDLAKLFRQQALKELGLALRSQFRYAVRHQRQAASGAEALQTVVRELRRLSDILEDPNVSREHVMEASKGIAACVGELEALVAAAVRDPSVSD